MIDVSAPLMSHNHLYRHVRDVVGVRGLAVVGVGRAGERGFQMLYRFADACDRLEACGINVIFVYPKESVRHVFDAASIRAARYRQKECLFLDEGGRFFRKPIHTKSLRAIYLDNGMQPNATTDVTLLDETWDELLRAFFAKIIGRCLH
ncbi:hypothetical protein [Paraburkholderia rhizosphaerae]|uniref:Uncharacterized protein n=1 Tax=Paraburkholderia rhizosphaerae TaxID=480658 RepID=A0A4R8LZX6_9BURK|nr:hypothetical protein [Paraburkholderia rhizosphaerae]TDY52439.1 hypothetical protein BX592_105325 [Paraburkholderia rhizosphaerae]